MSFFFKSVSFKSSLPKTSVIGWKLKNSTATSSHPQILLDCLTTFFYIGLFTLPAPHRSQTTLIMKRKMARLPVELLREISWTKIFVGCGTFLFSYFAFLVGIFITFSKLILVRASYDHLKDQRKAESWQMLRFILKIFLKIFTGTRFSFLDELQCITVK